MGRKIKRGEVGLSTKYVTRAKAIKKLQVSLKDFRRLCILKGVYPREPPKKLLKTGKTFYHKKDINFLACERVLDKFREIKTHLKKVKKAKVKGDKLKVKNLQKKTPVYNLNHLVKERYPTFNDALRDLDDPLCMANLFAIFPSHKDHGIQRSKIETSIKLVREFNNLVIQQKSLKKVFLSIKGIYYQAEIDGQIITWIQPYQLPANLPLDVDYKVMLTFLEFYEVMLKFVLFKLYRDIRLQYPPQIDNSVETQNYFCYKSILTTEIQLIDDDTNKFKIDEKFKSDENVEKLQNKNKDSQLFNNLVFFLSSEVPRYSLEFVILCFGGKVFWLGDGSDITQDDQKITHFITDRDPSQLKILKKREYVQPQWVYDCINNKILLPIRDYAPGKILPPHLSPFTMPNDTYVPQRQKEIALLKGEIIDVEDEEEEDVDIEQEKFNKEKDDQMKRYLKIEELKDKKLHIFNDAPVSDDDIKIGTTKKKQNKKQEIEIEEESSDSEQEDEQIIEEDEISSDVAEELNVNKTEEKEEKQYDYEQEKIKKSKKEKQDEKEQKELAKKLMSKKNQFLHKVLSKDKRQEKRQTQQLKEKAKNLVNKKVAQE